MKKNKYKKKKYVKDIRITRGLFSVNSILPKIKNRPNKKKRKRNSGYNRIKLIEYDVNIDSLKLKVFKKSLRCKTCGIKGNVFLLELNREGRNARLNLYHKKRNGKLILMTVDHIKPKSKGGNNNMNNLQTMCEPCNQIKGNKYKENK